MGASGNALLVVLNKPSSGKKITITNVEIQNNTRFNSTATANTYVPPSIRMRALRPAAVYGGESIVPVKIDSASSNIPSGVQFFTGAAISFNFLNALGSSTFTASVTTNTTAFNPSPSPTWITNEHRDAERYLIIDSGSNAGRYEIVSNTATGLVVDPPFSTTEASVTGYIAEIDDVVHDGYMKNLNLAVGWMPNMNYGVLHGKPAETGQLWDYGLNTNTQPLTVRPDEEIAIAVDKVHFNLPCFVDATIRIGTSVYQFSFFTRFNSSENSPFVITNDTGSGVDVELINFSVSEVGSLDTPYFQLVPIGAVNPAIFTDSLATYGTIATDSDYPALNSDICQVFTNAPLLPLGVPTSYIAEGAPVAAAPRGFNYLNTKDFIGPVYATYFPEAAGHKIDTGGYWTATPGTGGAQLSMPMSKFVGTPTNIVIRESEGFAIVSGAETATGTIAVGISGWGSYDFAIDLKVENAFTPALTITGLKDSTEVRIFDSSSGDELAGIESVVDGSVDNRSFTWLYDYTPGESVDIMIVALGYQIIRLSGIALTTTGLSIPIQQQVDRWYSNP